MTICARSMTDDVGRRAPPSFSNAVQPILQENYPFLRQKICLMALIESVFKRGAYDRTLSFQTIAEETRLPIDDVEHLLMKALR